MNKSDTLRQPDPEPVSSRRIKRYYATSILLGVAFTAWACWQHYRWGQGHAFGGSFTILLEGVFLILGSILVWGIFERFDKPSRPFAIAAQSVACLIIGVLILHQQMKTWALQGFRDQISEVSTPKACREWAESYYSRSKADTYPDWDSESKYVRNQLLPLRKRAYPQFRIETLGQSNVAMVTINWPAGHRDWRLTCAIGLSESESDQPIFETLDREAGEWASPIRWGAPKDHIFLSFRPNGK